VEAKWRDWHFEKHHDGVGKTEIMSEVKGVAGHSF
jgi:hypothetical protein